MDAAHHNQGPSLILPSSASPRPHARGNQRGQTDAWAMSAERRGTWMSWATLALPSPSCVCPAVNVAQHSLSRTVWKIQPTRGVLGKPLSEVRLPMGQGSSLFYPGQFFFDKLKRKKKNCYQM